MQTWSNPPKLTGSPEAGLPIFYRIAPNWPKSTECGQDMVDHLTEFRRDFTRWAGLAFPSNHPTPHFSWQTWLGGSCFWSRVGGRWIVAPHFATRSARCGGTTHNLSWRTCRYCSGCAICAHRVPGRVAVKGSRVVDQTDCCLARAGRRVQAGCPCPPLQTDVAAVQPLHSSYTSSRRRTRTPRLCRPSRAVSSVSETGGSTWRNRCKRMLQRSETRTKHNYGSRKKPWTRRTTSRQP